MMASDKAALLEVLEAMQVAEVEDLVRTAAQTIYEGLTDAELTAVIGAGPWGRTDQCTTQRYGLRDRTLRTTVGIWSRESPSCDWDRSSRCRSSGVTGSNMRCSRRSWRSTCTLRGPGDTV
jgi:hypothetical protein